jgi:hypothetical protein
MAQSALTTDREDDETAPAHLVVQVQREGVWTDVVIASSPMAERIAASLCPPARTVPLEDASIATRRRPKGAGR